LRSRLSGNAVFAAWKKVFDSHASPQSASGLSNPRLFPSADDPSEIVVLFDAAETSKAKQFAASFDLRSAMASAGVMDKPDIHILESAG
jgi:hypothetical protein